MLLLLFSLLVLLFGLVKIGSVTNEMLLLFLLLVVIVVFDVDIAVVVDPGNQVRNS